MYVYVCVCAVRGAGGLLLISASLQVLTCDSDLACSRFRGSNPFLKGGSAPGKPKQNSFEVAMAREASKKTGIIMDGWTPQNF